MDVVYSTGCFIYFSAPQKSIIDFTKRIHRAAMSHAQIGFGIFQFVNNRQTEISAKLKNAALSRNNSNRKMTISSSEALR